MRKFNLKLGDQVIGWSLTVEDAVKILDKLYEDEYTLTCKDTREVAYQLLSFYRSINASSVMDKISDRYLDYDDLIRYEHEVYDQDTRPWT